MPLNFSYKGGTIALRNICAIFVSKSPTSFHIFVPSSTKLLERELEMGSDISVLPLILGGLQMLLMMSLLMLPILLFLEDFLILGVT